MPEGTAKVEPALIEEERLAHALVTRGLITRDEFRQVRNGASAATTVDDFLKKLVGAGFLTDTQARRAAQDLPAVLNQPVPGYQLMEKVGQGAMGTVYKAKQLSMDRVVAVKVLNPKLAANKEFLERFKREAHLA